MRASVLGPTYCAGKERSSRVYIPLPVLARSHPLCQRDFAFSSPESKHPAGIDVGRVYEGTTRFNISIQDSVWRLLVDATAETHRS